MADNEITGSQTDDQDTAVAEEDAEKDPKARLIKVIGVKVTDTGVLRKTVSISVPRESLNEELDREYTDLLKDSIVPGFRRGRAPRRLVEKRFGQEVGAQVQTRVVSNSYLAAVEKEDLKVLGDPLVWCKPKGKPEETKEELVDMPTALQLMKLPDDGPLEFRCEVEVKPVFELPELEGVEVEKPILKITDEDVTTQVDRMRARRGTWSPVIDGKVQPDDMLVCDVVVTVGGKEVKKQENVQIAARPTMLEGVALENLGDELKGAKTGETRETEGELPADYPVEDLRGKKAKFALTVQEIKRLQLPALDKEYLESQGFDSEKDYRAWVHGQMEQRLDQEIRRGMRNQVRKYLLEKTKLDLPEGLSSRMIERTVIRRAIELQRQGVPISEIEKHSDELRTSATAQAIVELKLNFILEEIAEKLEIDVSEEEINAQIAAISQTYNRRFDRVRDELLRNNGLEALYREVRDDKCVDHILEKAKVVEAKPKKESEGEKKPGKTAAAKSEKGDEEKADKKKDKSAGEEKPKAAKKAPKKKE